MIMAKQVKWNFDFDEDVNLIGISCHKFDYWIALQINKTLKLNLIRQPDLSVFNQEKGSSINYPLFDFIKPDIQTSFALVSNHNPEGKLFSDQKSFDYFLLINGLINADEKSKMITAIKKHDQLKGDVKKVFIKTKPEKSKSPRTKIIISSFFLLALAALGFFIIPKLIKPSGPIEKSIAVLPFDNLSNDPEQEFFVDGMVDEILDRLFKVGDMKVISRTSSMRYKNTTLSLKEIARELGVSAVLEGSVQKIGNDVHITVQLIDAKTDTHLWSDTFEGNLTDAFAFQSNVALGVARELKAILTSKETILIQNAVPTTNQAAYDYYLKGNDYSIRLITDSALRMYTKAIQEDPLFAAAYAKRAKAHMYRYWTKNEGWEGHDQQAREDIKTGFKLNPELAELKMVQAYGYYQLDRKYDEALKILSELKTIAPNIADLYA